MAHNNEHAKMDKISSAFKARLDRLKPEQKVRAIVLLHIKNAGAASQWRQSRAERKAAIEAIRTSTEPALVDIDSVLERFDGRRLAPHVNALGSVPVETTAAGIAALADLEHVKTILEDQPISLLSGS